MSIIYEVKITVDPKQDIAFVDWINHHIKEMLSLGPFLDAKLYKLVGEQAQPTYCVQYFAANKKELEQYFAFQAKAMRQQGANKFGDAIHIERKILVEEPLEQTRT